MKFTPKTEKQIQEELLFPAGVYTFDVVKAEDRVSSKGNDMIALTLKVYDADGNGRLVNDYLLESMAFKLRHAAEAVGLLEKYEEGVLAAIDFEGRSGTCKIKISKDKTGTYADKNDVADYMTEKHAAEFAAQPKEPTIDDTIPF